MRSRIIYAFLTLFLVFTAGAAITMGYLYNTTNNLQSVISLHRVEIIRQDLVINAQTVQSHLYAYGTAYGQELDVIIDNVIALDESAHSCLGCHHTQEITQRLEEVTSLVEQYQEAMSYLMTSSANEERIQRLRTVAIGIGTTLLDKVQQMSFIAGNKLNDKTVRSLNEINNSRSILIVTLVLSFFIAIAIAVGITKQMTEPINELLGATRRIKAGEFGYTTPYKTPGEFGELIDSFNDMSLSLDESNKKVMRHLHSLSNLYSITLMFHSTTEPSEIGRELVYGVAELVGAEQCGLMVIRDDELVHQLPVVGLDDESAALLRIPIARVMEIYAPSNRRAFYLNDDMYKSPTAELDKRLGVHNLMYVWVRQKGKLIGAIRVANKRGGPFTEEDVRPMAILANNLSVALENAQLYEDLRRQMRELKDAQEQLVQAAKLVAIGELASNVAHELNNPLTSVLGYAELLREEHDISIIMRDLSVIEKETLRAREIVRQLLEFSRKRPMVVKAVDVNRLLDEVLSLVFLKARGSKVGIHKLYRADIPIMADGNQLKQVFVNLINNAVFAMKGKGELSIETNAEGQFVHVLISDTGEGIPKELMVRIFEPFFSTKKEKGTGIGLSVSYKIIESHHGKIDVKSDEGKGTTFTVTLPLNSAVSQEETATRAS